MDKLLNSVILKVHNEQNGDQILQGFSFEIDFN